jgi:hypothetical protein
MTEQCEFSGHTQVSNPHNLGVLLTANVLFSFTLEFDQFVASIGPGVAVSESRKNCQLILDLQYPQGWSYSILQTTFRGYVAIDAGVTATQEAVYYFSGG